MRRWDRPQRTPPGTGGVGRRGKKGRGAVEGVGGRRNKHVVYSVGRQVWVRLACSCSRPKQLTSLNTAAAFRETGSQRLVMTPANRQLGS